MPYVPIFPNNGYFWNMIIFELRIFEENEDEKREERKNRRGGEGGQF